MTKQQIRVEKVPEPREPFIKALRLIGQMDLVQATDVANELARLDHSIVVAGIDAEVANHIADGLRSAGAEVIVEDSTTETPMRCMPKVNVKYEWGPLRSIRKTG